MNDIWILGAAGRSGRATAALLAARGASIVLVGRNAASLQELGGGNGGNFRVVVADSIEAMAAEIKKSRPAVVVNLIGPFAETAPPIIRALAPGGHYVDISNELPAALAVLELHDEAVAAGRSLVTGAGFGVLATESVVLKLCANQPPAEKVRVDMMPFVDCPGILGRTVATTIVSGIPLGGRRYQNGWLVRANVGSDFETLMLPDGKRVGTGAAPLGELEAARRASGASFAISASSMVPGSALVRALLPLAAPLFSWAPLREWVIRRIAAINVPPVADHLKNASSWAHARVEWPDGRIREGWLRAGEAMDFTARVTAEVAFRLSRNEGRPGAFTPGALFGPELAIQAGGQFLLDSETASFSHRTSQASEPTHPITTNSTSN